MSACCALLRILCVDRDLFLQGNFSKRLPSVTGNNFAADYTAHGALWMPLAEREEVKCWSTSPGVAAAISATVPHFPGTGTKPGTLLSATLTLSVYLSL